MFGYLLARLWKNPVSRIVFLAAFGAILFGIIYSSRHELYKFFSRKFSSADWSDTYTHRSHPYAFEENEGKARSQVEAAWGEIHDLARKKLGDDKGKETLRGVLKPRPFSDFLYKNAEEEIFTFLNALKANCGHLLESVNITDHTKPMGSLDAEKSTSGKIAAHLKANMRALLAIHATRVETALQKKPDYLPAIELSEEIFRATCSVREIPVLLARAMDYREYYLQKQVYDNDNGRLYEKNPELFQLKISEIVAKDPAHRELFSRYFDSTKYRTPYNPAHLKNMRNAYTTLRNAKTVTALIAALLAEARNSPTATAKKCHFELFALDYPGVAERSDYIYALAETALRGDEPVRAANIIGNALKSPYIKEESVRTDLERLRFHLDLERHESENISRF